MNMDFDHKIRTPQKKYFVVFVCCIAVLSLTTFLIFGHFLSEYMAYAVDKQKAQDEISATKRSHEELKEYLGTQEDDYKTRLSNVKKMLDQRDAELAERDAKIKSQQDMVDKINVLSNQLATAKTEYVQFQNDLKTVQKNLDVAKISHATLAASNEDLQKKSADIQKEHESQKADCLKDIALWDQVKQGKDKDIEKLVTQKADLESQAEKLNEKILLLKEETERSRVQLDDERLKLSSVTTQLNSIASRIQQETAKLPKIISDQNDLQAALIKDKSERERLNEEILVLQRKISEFQTSKEQIAGEFKSLTQQKSALVGDVVDLQSLVVSEQKKLDSLKSKITQEQQKQQGVEQNKSLAEKDPNNAK